MASKSAAVVTVSDGVSQGVRDDSSGQAVGELLRAAGFEVVARDVVPDERDLIAELFRSLADRGIALIVSTGGTGFGPRDVTPEATREVIEREAPGLAEAMRAVGRSSTPFAMLSREVVGSRGSTLIVNLPGSEKGARESLQAILDVLPHALDLLAGETVHGPSDADGHGGHRNAKGAVVRPEDAELDEQLAARRAGGEDLVLATAVRVEGNPPCRLGQKLLLGSGGPVSGTLGCAEFDAAAVADGPGVLRAGTPTTRTYEHELGTIEVFLEPIVHRPRLLVFSATPVAQHLIRWARDLGFEPTLVESREDRVRPEHRGARLARSLDDVALGGDTFAVHTDHDAPGVAGSLARLLRSPAPFIGVMGSRRHVGPYVAELREMGFGEEDLARIRTPLGIDIGGRSAEEIALSIVAGLVAARHGATGGWLDADESSAGPVGPAR